MNRADLEEKIADYAFGSLSEKEREAFAAELPNYPDLANEYHTVWQPTIEALPLAVEPVDLPVGMRQRVLGEALGKARTPVVAAQTAKPNAATATQSAASATPPNLVGAARQAAPATAAHEPMSLAGNWWRKLVVLFSRPAVALTGLAVMLVISLVSVGWGLSLNDQLNHTRAQLSSSQQEVTELLADHSARILALQPTTHWQQGYGTAVYDPDKNMVYVTLSGPPPTEDVDCQLWAVKQGQTTSLGVFRMNAWTVGRMLYAPANLNGYDTLMISWEKPGGASSPTPGWIMVEGQIQNN